MRHGSNGAVRISVLLILGTVLYAFTPAPSWAQSLKKRSQLTVVDVKGKKVGRVFGIGSGTFIRRPAGIEGGSGVLVAFQVTGHPPLWWRSRPPIVPAVPSYILCPQTARGHPFCRVRALSWWGLI